MRRQRQKGFQGECWNCGIVGHSWHNCRKPQREVREVGDEKEGNGESMKEPLKGKELGGMRAVTWADEVEKTAWFGELSAVMNGEEASDEECPV